MEKKVIKLFEKLGIDYDIIYHDKIYKATDRVGKNINFKGAVCCKNLFVKEQSGENKGKLYLISLAIDKKANLKEIESKLNLARLTFASENELVENLGIKSGNASILNIIQKPDTNVTFLIDTELLSYNKVAFHPNDNSMSIIFSPIYIKYIMEEFNVKYYFI